MDISLCRDSTLASSTPEKRHWEFPCLEIPEAPLQHGGAPLGSSLSRDLRGSNTKRRRFTRGCTTWGSTTNSVCKKSTYICSNLLERLWGSITSFCVQEVDLHLFKPLGKVVGVHNKFLCARGRPMSVQTSWSVYSESSRRDKLPYICSILCSVYNLSSSLQ